MGELTFDGVLRTPAGRLRRRQTMPAGAARAASATGPGGYTYGDFGKIAVGPGGALPTARSGSRPCGTCARRWTPTARPRRSDLTEELVTRGMELSPPSPSFLDMRNAILQADHRRQRRAPTRPRSGRSSPTGAWATSPRRSAATTSTRSRTSRRRPTAAWSLQHDISGTVTDKATGEPLRGRHRVLPRPGLGLRVQPVRHDRSRRHLHHRGRARPRRLRRRSLSRPTATRPKHRAGRGGRRHIETLDNALVRDWASLSGGAVAEVVHPAGLRASSAAPTPTAPST